MQIINFLGREFSHFSAVKSLQFQIAYLYTFQKTYVFTDRLEHFSDFSVSALGYGNVHFREIFALFHDFNSAFIRLFPVDNYAVSERNKRFFVYIALNFYQIGLRNFTARVSKPVREVAVIGKQKKPLGIVIEPSNGKNSRRVFWKQVHNGLSALVVLYRANVTLRFVHNIVLELSRSRYFFPVNGNAVVNLVYFLAESAYFTVYFYSFFLNNLIASASARYAALGKIPVYSHLFCSSD